MSPAAAVSASQVLSTPPMLSSVSREAEPPRLAHNTSAEPSLSAAAAPPPSTTPTMARPASETSTSSSNFTYRYQFVGRLSRAVLFRARSGLKKFQLSVQIRQYYR